MATDARGHTVPAATDHPQRQDLLALSLTTNGLTTVADTTARTAYIAALAAASPAQTVSTSKPAFIYRTDSATMEMSVDGTNWFVIPAMQPQAYTPTWTATTTNPVIGNGSITGEWVLKAGLYLHVIISITVGSTTTVGSGNYSLGLPAAGGTPATGKKDVMGNFFDASAPNNYPFVGRIDGTNTMVLTNGGFPQGSITAAAPVVPATGDLYHFDIEYRIA